MNQNAPVATGKSIILEIVRCLTANVEPLLYSTIAPARYFVYLHPSDFERLEGVFPRLAVEARRALDEEVARWNAMAKGRRSPLDKLLGKSIDPAPPIEPPAGGWEVQFEPDAEGEMQPGDIAVASELVLPARPELSGSRTRRVTTLKQGDRTSVRERMVDAAPAGGGTVLARLAYEDRMGVHRVPLTSAQVVIGRGGAGCWVDVKIDTSTDVSREHLRLRRDDATGEYFLKDLSTLGTSVDGVRVPSSIEIVDGVKRDRNVEVPLPPRARIGLADTVFVDFEAGAGA
jgi:hypothetical protein